MIRFFAIAVVLISSVNAELIATFSKDGKTDVRMDRFPALSVPAGQPPTPFLEAGKFETVWTGEITLKERRRLYFSFAGTGKASLTIDGKVALSEEGKLGTEKSKRLRLNPGAHEIVLNYESAADGSAEFRLYWEEEEMPRQTIPATVYSAEASDVAKLGQLQRHGRMVFTEQNCAKCHSPEAGFGANPMPETGEIGPLLAGAGERITEEWLRKWIADPKALKPTTNMPQLVDPTTPEGLQKASDLAAFLVSSEMGSPATPEPDPSLAKEGGVHFHELGCVACHFPSGTENLTDDTRRIPLNNVASKYLPGQLVAFLKKPEAYHPFTEMPNFQLSDEEANSIAAFLRTESTARETKMSYDFPAGDATRGAEVAESLQCGTCHPGLPGGVSKSASLEAIFQKNWAEAGCIAPTDKRPELPVLNLTDENRSALTAFSKTGTASLNRDNPAEFATRQIDAKRCTACHSLDGDPSLLSSLHGSTAALAAHVQGLNERVDQTRPQLTFIGEMLYTSYIEKMLNGTAEPRPRPWLGTRMPAFSAYATPLAEGLSRLHGFAPSSPEKVETDPELVKIGGELIGKDGFGCTTCHAVGDQKATAAFEVDAVNFNLVPQRLQKGYYLRWMDHPAAVIPGNKMPKYAEGNESQRSDILDGDAGKQYEAIWQWLQTK